MTLDLLQDVLKSVMMHLVLEEVLLALRGPVDVGLATVAAVLLMSSLFVEGLRCFPISVKGSKVHFDVSP